MSEYRQKIDVNQVSKLCDTCKEGRMVFDCTINFSAVGLTCYTHTCDKCKNKADYAKQYPYIEYSINGKSLD